MAGWLAGAAFTALAADIEIRWTSNVEVTGLAAATLLKSDRSNADWQRFLSVRADQGSVISDIGLPPIAGTYSVDGKKLVFKPQFPFSPGVSYRAVVRGEGSNLFITSEFKAPVPTAASTSLTEIYPTLDQLPENILKFYLEFSGPMSGGHIYDYMELRDANGKVVELPFLEIDEELWNPEMTRLTLFLDPGRIKRGVKPLEEIGPALVPGKEFTLHISRQWRDANGNPLEKDFEKRFAVLDADREMPDPNKWRIIPPPAFSRARLTLIFDEALDHAMASRVLRIADPEGKPLEGEASLGERDRNWYFRPTTPWRYGEHTLLIPSIIEDVAGNTIAKPFDVDLTQKAVPMTNSIVRLPFLIQ